MRSRPKTARSAADASVSVFMWRFTKFRGVAHRPNASPTSRNETPIPSEYAMSSEKARTPVWVAATPKTAAITGPRHGDQPNANAAPRAAR